MGSAGPSPSDWAQEGADVVVTDIQRSVERMREEDRQAGWRGLPSVIEEIEDMGRQGLGLYSDVSDSAQVAEMVNAALERFGRIDILVNNAGSQPGRDRVLVVDLEEDAFDEVVRVNLRGTYLVSKAVSQHMINRGGGGKIIVISSGAGLRGRSHFAAYCSSKFALIGFTQSLAEEMGPHKVNVNAILPRNGGHRTLRLHRRRPRARGQSAEEHRALMIRERSRLPRWAGWPWATTSPRTAAFLASAESDYLTGLAISVSGGSQMH